MKHAINSVLHAMGYHIEKWKYNTIPHRTAFQFMQKYFQNKPIIGAEVGVLDGKNAVDILTKMPNIKHLYLIDPWVAYGKDDTEKGTERVTQAEMDASYQKTLQAINPFRNKVTIIREYSSTAVNKLPMLDFAYIDGNHEYTYVLRDLYDYQKKIKLGGVLAGNDVVSEGHDGVVAAMLDFIRISKLKPYIQSPDYWFVNGEMRR